MGWAVLDSVCFVFAFFLSKDLHKHFILLPLQSGSHQWRMFLWKERNDPRGQQLLAGRMFFKHQSNQYSTAFGLQSVKVHAGIILFSCPFLSHRNISEQFAALRWRSQITKFNKFWFIATLKHQAESTAQQTAAATRGTHRRMVFYYLSTIIPSHCFPFLSASFQLIETYSKCLHMPCTGGHRVRHCWRTIYHPGSRERQGRQAGKLLPSGDAIKR